MEMIKISKIEQLLKNLEDLEKDFAAGNIPKKQYQSLKKQYNNRLETLEAAERIKRMQGRGTSEKTLDHWSSKSKASKDEEEQEELIKKFVTTPKPRKKTQNTEPKGGISRFGLLAGILLALALCIGAGFGVMLFNTPVASDNSTVNVNQSAFPTVENLTNNTTTIISNITKTNTTKTTNNTNSGGNSGGNNNSGGNTGNTGGTGGKGGSGNNT